MYFAYLKTDEVKKLEKKRMKNIDNRNNNN